MSQFVGIDALGIGPANPDVFQDKAYADGWNAVIKILDNAPTIDAVPVVRCRECKYWRKHTCIYTCQDEGYCVNPDGLDNFAHPDDYCSYGVCGEGETDDGRIY